jgi:uncharacterized RDD family membrane protein YckC
MQKTHSVTEINNLNPSSLDAEIFVPIDLDWRKKYYRKVVWKRCIAFVLDMFTTYIIAIVIAEFLLLISVPSKMLFSDESTNSDIFFFIIGMIQLICFILLCAIMESSKWHGTIGKRIMKIQITDDYGNSISFFRSVVRNLLRIVIGYSYFFILPLIFQYYRFKKIRKLFHDELSHTVIGERL